MMVDDVWILFETQGQNAFHNHPEHVSVRNCGCKAAILCLAAEVKKYEIYDGITFQWFMCAGILMVGFLSSIIFGDFGMKDAENHLTVGSFERSGTGQIAL